MSVSKAKTPVPVRILLRLLRSGLSRGSGFRSVGDLYRAPSTPTSPASPSRCLSSSTVLKCCLSNFIHSLSSISLTFIRDLALEHGVSWTLIFGGGKQYLGGGGYAKAAPGYWFGADSISMESAQNLGGLAPLPQACRWETPCFREITYISNVLLVLYNIRT